MHRWSQLFIPTLREAPADAEVASHKFLVRAGYIRQLAAGIYSYLFLGNRSFNKIMGIVREEMDRIGQEFYLPALHPREIWEASGRWALMGDNLFRLKDRRGADLALGMTEEEVMTSIALKELRSYKQLPQIWYQIAPKFRDEPRPKSGLLRVRQFMMKDAYSFDIDAAGLDVSYKKHYETYCRIFDRCGLKYMVVEADSGAMGGKESHEFMVRTPAGEDQIVSCDGCKYAANMEKASSKLEAVEDLATEGDGKPLEVHTPGQKTIEDVAKFLGVSPRNKIKTLALMADEKDASGKTKVRAIVVLMRGKLVFYGAPQEALDGRRLVPHENVLHIDADAQLGCALQLILTHQTSVDDDEPLLTLYRAVLAQRGAQVHLRPTFIGSDTSAFRPRIKTFTLSTGVMNEHSTEEYIPLVPMEQVVQDTLEVLQQWRKQE